MRGVALSLAAASLGIHPVGTVMARYWTPQHGSIAALGSLLSLPSVTSQCKVKVLSRCHLPGRHMVCITLHSTLKVGLSIVQVACILF